MRLRRLELTRYGKFTGYPIDFGEDIRGTPDLHIIYGLNEAGKSTALSGYLDLLFGIEERTRYAFLHQYGAMEVGAVLEFGNGAHELRRVKQRVSSLLDARGQPVNEALLSVPLAGLTRDAYRMMFSLDDQTLEDGGNAIIESRSDLGELLFSASAGLSDVSKTLEAIGAEADDIFRKRASSTQIAGLKRQLADLKSRRDKIDVQASAHAVLVAAFNQAEHAYGEAARERAVARTRHEELGRILRANPLVNEHRRVCDDLSALQHLPRPPGHWASEVPRVMTDEAGLQARLESIDDRARRLREEIETVEVDERLLRLAERLDRLPEGSARFRTAEDDLPKRRSALVEVESRIEAIVRTLGRDCSVDPETLPVPAPIAGALRDLIEERSGAEAAVKAAEQELEGAKLALDHVREDRNNLDRERPLIEDGRIPAIEVIIARLRQSDVFARQRLAERDLPQRQKQFDEAVAVLAPWSGESAELRALAAPDGSQIEAWRALSALLEGRRSKHSDGVRDLVTQQREQTARATAIRAAAGNIGDDDAAALRADREAAWMKHLEDLDRESARAFESKMRAADEMAEARLNNAHDLAEMRSLRAALAVTAAQIERQRELLSEVDRETKELREDLRRAMPIAVGTEESVPAGRLVIQIERWVKNRARAIAALEELEIAKDAVNEAAAEVNLERELLANALAAISLGTEKLSLPALLQTAETALAENTARRNARDAADKAVRDRQRDVATRRRALDAATAALRDWQDRWKAALGGTWFADRGSSMGAIREILDVLANLPAELQARAGLRYRIDAMERDRHAFVADMAALYAELGEEPDPDAVLQSAKSLGQRHEQAKQSLQRRRQKEVDLAELAAEREKLAAETVVHEARKNELLRFFSVTHLAEVSDAIGQCAARDRLEEDRKKLSLQIVSEMQAPSLAEAFERLSGADLAEVEQENAELALRLEDLDERVKVLFAEKSRASDRLNEIGGDDAVARIETERRTVLLEIQDLALRFLRLKTGGMLAEHAIRAFRERHRSSMMNRASEAFRLITRGEYTGLATRPEKDREALIGLSRHGGSKLAGDMSKGTRFQLYLALRLAGYEEFAAVRPSVPFIADDIMETFDEPRSEEVFRLFGQMASVGQVVYLTHHRHLCEIARQVVPAVRVHEMGA